MATHEPTTTANGPHFTFIFHVTSLAESLDQHLLLRAVIQSVRSRKKCGSIAWWQTHQPAPSRCGVNQAHNICNKCRHLKSLSYQAEFHRIQQYDDIHIRSILNSMICQISNRHVTVTTSGRDSQSLWCTALRPGSFQEWELTAFNVAEGDFQLYEFILPKI